MCRNMIGYNKGRVQMDSKYKLNILDKESRSCHVTCDVTHDVTGHMVVWETSAQTR